MPFRCAVLSAVKHDYVARGVATHPRFQLVVVADDPDVPTWAHERNQHFAEAHGIPYVRDAERALREYDVQVAIVKRSGRNVLLLSGGNPNAASHNETGGFSIRLPDTFEAAVSSHRVRVTISVKAAQGLADAEFSMAYSTAEVGNSRWQRMSIGNQFETLSFEWDVPKMIDGNSDFVGILPGEAGAIEVAGLALFAIPRAETQMEDSPAIPQPA
ncbi:MAG: hypothetical protein ABMA14_00225 [Hyphomonadaceae bacterium]